MRLVPTVAALALAAFSGAQVSVSKNTGYPNKIGMPRAGLSPQDTAFIRDAAAANSFEVQTSKLALVRGGSTFVKAFAREMVADHTAAYDELAVTAKKLGMSTTANLPPKLAATVNRLKGLNGAEFDAAYLAAQRTGHADTAKKFETQIKRGREASLKNYAIKTLPAVKMHQKMLLTQTTQTGPMKMKHGM